MALAALVGALLATSAFAAADDALLVDTDAGQLEGVMAQSGLSRAWRGVPFASPPTPELDGRFELPRAVVPWEGTRGNFDAPGCPQTCNMPPGTCPLETSEDCLYLNVFAPSADVAATFNDDGGVPVLVFFPGGRFEQGTANCPLYDGASLAELDDNPIITVVVSYRLGVLGYLASESMSGNYGLNDQRAALEWVQRNIAAFGGDPARVTISGQSAGAMSVGAHLTSAKSDGLYSQAIMDSNPLALPYHTSVSAADLAATVADSLGCPPDDVTCFKSASVDAILQAQKDGDNDLKLRDVLSSFVAWGPIVSDDDVAEQPFVALSNGRGSQRGVPLLLGSTKDDGQLFVYELFGDALGWAGYDALLGVIFGVRDGYKVGSVYPPSLFGDKKDTRPVLNEFATEMLFACPNRNLTRGLLESADDESAAVYLYQFNEVWSFDGWGPDYPFCIGEVCHASELPFLFNVFSDGEVQYNVTAEESQLAADLMSYYAAFVTSGDPSNGSAGERQAWPAYTRESDESLQFDEPLAVVDGLRKDRCDFWDGLGYYF